MGIYDLLSDIAASLGVSSVDADAPPKDDEKGEDGGEEVKGEGEEKEEPEAEPEEEEEEEPEDLKPKLEEGEFKLVWMALGVRAYGRWFCRNWVLMSSLECANSKQCAPYKHHYDECAERVAKQVEESEDGKAKEDCVEECMSCCFTPAFVDY